MVRSLPFLCILILVLALVSIAGLRAGCFDQDGPDWLFSPVAVYLADNIRQSFQMQRFPDVSVQPLKFTPSSVISRAPPA
jgi:hypothetical protein